MRTRIIFCLILAMISFSISSGQKAGKKVSVTGHVVDGTDASVANAIIIVDGEKTDYVTNKDGFYKIKVSQDNTRIGIFTTTNGIIEEALNGRNIINFKFSGSVPFQDYDKTNKRDEVVDIGYRKVKRNSLTSPVGEIDGTKSKYESYNNIYEMIRGEVPGVSVNGTSIIIRSATTINANSDPLFIVDGVPVITIDNIAPQMVRSISILKGSSAAIYGSRGSNGVIIINLKTGKDK